LELGQSALRESKNDYGWENGGTPPLVFPVVGVEQAGFVVQIFF